MEKIIKNKVYDTDTARLQGGWWNGYDTIDVEYATEDLYLKKTGEFFLHCQSEGRQMIYPLTYEEARQWAEDFLTDDEYEGIFGEIEEDDGWIPLHAFVKNNLMEEINKEKQIKGLSLKEIVNAALASYFNK